MLERGAPRTWHTTATGSWQAMAIWAASPAGSAAPFFGRRPQDLVLHGQLPDLAFGLLERPVIGRPVGPLALEPLLAAFQEVVPPGRQPVRLDPELAGEHIQRLAMQQSEHRVHLLADRPPGPRPVVAGLLMLVSLFTAMTGIFTPAYSVSKTTGSDGPIGKCVARKGRGLNNSA